MTQKRIQKMKRIYSTGKHWKQLSDKKIESICRVAIKHPRYSITRISKETKVSRYAVWKVLKENVVQREDKKKVLHYKPRHFTFLGRGQKISLVKRWKEGEKITSLSREFGVSRTTCYRIQKQYQSNFLSKRPRGKQHYRYKKGVEEKVMKFVLEYPDLSVRETAVVFSKKQSVSATYVYTVLRRYDITTTHKRYAYITVQTSSDISARYIRGMFGNFVQGMIVPIGFAGLVITSTIIVNTSDNDFRVRKTENKETTKVISLPIESKDVYGTWGALAVNTDKDTYKPGEFVRIGMTILDEKGLGKCYERLDISVSDPSGAVTKYPSDKEKIRSSLSCAGRTITDQADYALLLQPSKEGAYTISVSVSGHSANGSFIVKKDPHVSISRSSAIRVWPLTNYMMKIHVKTDKDFTGEIHETLPPQILIVPESTFSTKKDLQGQHITWRTSLKAGEEKEFVYTFDAPDVSPYAYHLQPLRLISEDPKQSMQEERAWQVAIDGL